MSIKLELETSCIHYLIPHIYFSTAYGTSIIVSFLCFNLKLYIFTIKNYNNYFYFYSPSVTLQEYLEDSPYRYKFEICALGYVYRKSFMKNKKVVNFIYELYNTPGFVKSGWFNQFIESDYNMENFNEFMQDMNNLIDKYKERYNKKS